MGILLSFISFWADTHPKERADFPIYSPFPHTLDRWRRTVNQWRLQINARYHSVCLPEVGTNTACRCPMRPPLKELLIVPR